VRSYTSLIRLFQYCAALFDVAYRDGLLPTICGLRQMRFPVDLLEMSTYLLLLLAALVVEPVCVAYGERHASGRVGRAAASVM